MAMLNNQMVHMYVIVCISVCTAMVKSYIAYPYSALVITPLIEIYIDCKDPSCWIDDHTKDSMF